MKRSRKTLFALLLALVMTLGLAATAWATEVVPTDTNPFEKELSITKVVEKTGNVAPPAGNLHICAGGCGKRGGNKA